MLAYSADLRERVLNDCDLGTPTLRVARKYDVSPSWVRRLKQRRRESGQTTPRPAGGRRFGRIDRSRLAALSKADPDATLAELRERLGVACSLSAVHQALRKLKVTYKKR